MSNKHMKLVTILMVLLLSTILVSCKTTTKESSDSKRSDELIQTKDLAALLDTNGEDDDSQPYWSNSTNHSIAKGENGYYFLNEQAKNIMYYDKENKVCFPLCGKADCKHNDSSCNAYLGAGTHQIDQVYTYKGYLYLFALREGNVVLEQVNADGSGRKDIGTIGSNENDNSIKLVFHDNSIYIFNKGHYNSNVENKEVIKKISLDGKNEETVFEYTGTNAGLRLARSYGSKLFFIIDQWSLDDKKNNQVKSLGLYAYDYATGQTEKVIDADIADYCIDINNKDIFYYVYGEGLYKLNTGNQEKSKLFEAGEETGYCNLSFDGTYVYLSNQNWALSLNATKKIPKKLFVMDVDGAIINTINCDDFLQMYFGDDQFLFGRKINNENSNTLVYIDKKDIKNAKDWTFFTYQ